MTNILDLITRVEEDEALDFPDTQDEAFKESIATLVMERSKKAVFKKLSKKKLFLILLAATFLFGMAAFAADEGNWDIRLMKFWQLTDTTSLNGGNVIINQGSNCNHLKITALSSIGDKNNAVILLETDYQVSQKSPHKTDTYFLFDNETLSVTDKRGVPVSGWGSTMESFWDDDRLCFLLSITCADINRLNISLTLQDLYQYNKNTDESTLFLEGTWDFKWTYNYNPNVKSYYPLKTADCDGEKILITKIEVSPVSIRVSGIKNPLTGRKNWSYSDSFTIQKLFFKNNMESEAFTPTTGGNRNHTFLECNVMFHTPIDPDELVKLQIGNSIVKLSK